MAMAGTAPLALQSGRASAAQSRRATAMVPRGAAGLMPGRASAAQPRRATTLQSRWAAATLARGATAVQATGTAALESGRTAALQPGRPTAAGPVAMVTVAEGNGHADAHPAEGHEQGKSAQQLPRRFRRTGLPERSFWALRKRPNNPFAPSIGRYT